MAHMFEMGSGAIGSLRGDATLSTTSLTTNYPLMTDPVTKTAVAGVSDEVGVAARTLLPQPLLQPTRLPLRSLPVPPSSIKLRGTAWSVPGRGSSCS